MRNLYCHGWNTTITPPARSPPGPYVWIGTAPASLRRPAALLGPLSEPGPRLRATAAAPPLRRRCAAVCREPQAEGAPGSRQLPHASQPVVHIELRARRPRPAESAAEKPMRGRWPSEFGPSRNWSLLALYLFVHFDVAEPTPFKLPIAGHPARRESLSVCRGPKSIRAIRLP